MMEPGLVNEFTKRFGTIQFLDKTIIDPTAISYERKLESMLTESLVKEEITDKIKSKMAAIEIKAPHKLDKLKNLKIYHGYQHIKKIPELKSRDELLEELKVKQQQIQEKLERRLARLKKAFPTMSSEAISKFLNNKDEKKS